MTETLLAARVVTAGAVHAPGWVRIAAGRIAGVGSGRPPGLSKESGPVRDLGDATIVPGFVDVHVHGGGGGSYVATGPREAARASALTARAAHRAHGTVATLASLVTESPERLLTAVEALAELADGADGADDGANGDVGDAGGIRGIHLEGPWLSPARAGAHAAELLRDPDLAEIDALLAAGRGLIRMVTIAPELPGAQDAIRRLVDAGVTVAIGHTDADYATVRRAIDAGARVATHLFNAMRPLNHREPGPVLALMEDPRVAVELIADGVHLHPSLVCGVRRAVGADRVLLVTDAMDAAGHADGDYRLGALDVEVRGGVARVAGTDTIAGSSATMDQLFRAAVGAGSGAAGDAAASGASPSDAELIDAVRQTSTNQARLMGWSDLGDIAVGTRADLVVLDPRLRVREVLAA